MRSHRCLSNRFSFTSIKILQNLGIEFTAIQLSFDHLNFPKSIRLSLSYMPSSQSYELRIMHIENILNVKQIHHLEISQENSVLMHRCK
jgi:hypothetical protein